MLIRLCGLISYCDLAFLACHALAKAIIRKGMKNHAPPFMKTVKLGIKIKQKKSALRPKEKRSNFCQIMLPDDVRANDNSRRYAPSK